MSGPVRVLMVDDQPILHEAVRQMLADDAGLALTAIADPTDTVACAVALDPAVILLDLNMDPVDGLTVLAQLRADPRLTDVAVVMLSTAEEPLTKAEAFRRGANDYVVKLPSALELVARVRYHARSCLAAREREAAFKALLESRAELAAQNRRIEEQRHALELANRELETASLTDALTGLRNRRYLKRYFDAAVPSTAPAAGDRRHADGDRLCLFVFDLDHFKQINDRYGHDAGDAVLIEVAQRLRGRLRESDAMLRWGGEEFLVIARGLERAGAIDLASTLLQLIGGEAFALNPQTRTRVTCSIGCAPLPWPFTHGGGLSLDQILSIADAAAYLSKSAGRNQAHAVFPRADGGFAARLAGHPIGPEFLQREDGRGLEVERVSGVDFQ
jgi:two-component system chemotaxis family response regulator WspR